jgi:IclR family pca regulon transcriptional regulator
VLESFNKEKDNYTLSELARHLNIPKASLYRIVKDLAQMNYLRYEELSKRYYLGTRVLSLGYYFLENLELREIARPYLKRLSEECNKTINLAIFDKNEMVYVERIRVPGIRTANYGVGNRLPLWNTSVGRVFLAHLDMEKVEEMLKKAKESPDFKIDENRLFHILAEVRKKGFIVVNQEYVLGFLTLAVPIFSASGVAGAINLIGEPETTSIDILRNEYAPKLVNVGKELSKAMGYQG